MRLLNNQKALLFECIKELEFDPSQFELLGADTDARDVKLSMRGTEYYCSFWYDEGNPEYQVSASYVARICPGTATWERTGDVGPTYDGVVTAVIEWLRLVRDELNTPDPWLSLQNIPLPEDRATPTSPNTAFSYKEWEQLAEKMDGIRTYLLEQTNSSQETRGLINERIDKLIEDGKHLGRKDWFNQAIGLLASIAVTIGSQPEVVRGMWQLLKAAVHGLVHLAPVLAEGTKHIV